MYSQSRNYTMGIRELAEQAKALGAYDLAQGVINLPPPSVLINALRTLPFEQYSTYNNKRGVAEYREAVRAYPMTREWVVELSSIMATAGTMGGISSALLAELRPGAKVLLPEPFFIHHKLQLETLGFQPVYFRVPIDEPPDWQKIGNQFESADAAILTTPMNPTGQFADVDTLAKLSRAALQKKCLLLVDEMYREFIWADENLNDQ